jgi:hypothetical protein
MEAWVKVEKNGITIPIEQMKGIKEGDIVKIQIGMVYISPKDKKKLFPNKKTIYPVETSETACFIGRLHAQ